MPTNAQRRATAKRKLERQLERRAKQAKRRRILTIVGGSLAAVAVIVAVVVTVVVNKDDHQSTTSATPTDSASTSPRRPRPLPAAAVQAVGQPRRQLPVPAVAGQGRQTGQVALTGKVPTDPAQVSVSMVTNQGNIGLMLANNESPCTVNSFVSLAQQGFFKGTTCHRLTTSPMLAVLQCGDPKGDGTGGPGYQFANEYPTDQYSANDPKLNEPVIYPRGTLAMANAGPNTNSSQFFMVYRDSKLPPQYTVFGTIQADGLTTLDKIAKAGVAGGGEDGKPATEVTITSVLLD